MQSDANAKNRATPAWLTDANSFLLSAICHLLIFLALALLTVAAKEDGRLALWLDTDGNSEALLGDSLGGGAFELADQSSPLSNALMELTAAATAPAGITAADVNLFSDPFGSGEAGGSRGQGTGTGNGIGAEFFGIGGTGSTFVYVIDCSGSMLDMNKFKRAKSELMRSIRNLKSSQKFYVLLYSDGTYPMDASEPVPAIAEHIDRTEEWLNSVHPDGGTNPLPALLYALSLKPNAIYFLSDGKFDLSVAVELRIRNRSKRKQIPIHTIAFFNRETEGLMKMISRNSGAQYQFVKK